MTHLRQVILEELERRKEAPEVAIGRPMPFSTHNLVCTRLQP